MYGGGYEDHGDDAYCEHCGKWYPVTIGPPGHICSAMQSKWTPLVPEEPVAIGVIDGVNGRPAFVRPDQNGYFEYSHEPYWYSSMAEAEFMLAMLDDEDTMDSFYTETESSYRARAAAVKASQLAKAAAMRKVQNAKRNGLSKLPQVPTGQSGRKRVADSSNTDDSMFSLWKQALSKGYGPRP